MVTKPMEDDDMQTTQIVRQSGYSAKVLADTLADDIKTIRAHQHLVGDSFRPTIINICWKVEEACGGSEKQEALIRKVAAELRVKASPVVAAEGTLKPVHELFDKVKLKKPRFHLTIDGQEVVLSKAGEFSSNPGCLYVKVSGCYAGKISPAGTFSAAGAYNGAGADINLEPTLLEFAADPLAFAKAHGKETGTCCCCGRELTDPVSVANGIGPICESKWF